MKRSYYSLCLLFAAAYMLSQNEFAPQPPSHAPRVSAENLTTAKTLNNIFKLSYPLAFNYLKGWAESVDIQNVEVECVSNSKTIKAISKDTTLTAEQLKLIAEADMGSQVDVVVNFYLKNGKEKPRKINTHRYPVVILPHKQARFTGPQNSISNYFKKAVMAKLSNGVLNADQIERRLNEAIIRFIVDEKGQILNPSIFHSSTDLIIDAAILEVAKEMKNWLPAETEAGKKVKQEVTMNVLWKGSGC